MIQIRLKLFRIWLLLNIHTVLYTTMMNYRLDIYLAPTQHRQSKVNRTENMDLGTLINWMSMMDI